MRRTEAKVEKRKKELYELRLLQMGRKQIGLEIIGDQAYLPKKGNSTFGVNLSQTWYNEHHPITASRDDRNGS